MRIYKSRRVLQYVLILLYSLSACALLSGCFLLPREEKLLPPPLKQPDKIIYETYRVSRGTVENSITSTGYVVPVKSQNLQFQGLSGHISSMMFSVGDRVNKGDIMAEIDTHGVKQKIKKQKIHVKIAEIDLDAAKKSGDNESIKKAELLLELAELELEFLEEQLAMAEIKAPFDGIVTYCKRINIGDNIDEYDVVYTVADPSRKIIRYKGDDAEKFLTGMQVLIKAANGEYKGIVSSAPSEVPDSSMEDTAYIACELPDNIELGTDVFIRLIMEKRENVLCVPSSVIKRYSDRTFVKVMKDGLIEERDVVVGLITATNAEIISGLEENEEVVIW